MSKAQEPAIITCALASAPPDQGPHALPFTPSQMADAARDAFDAGATVIRFRVQQAGDAQSPRSDWNPDLPAETVGRIRDACPGVIICLDTGMVGADIAGLDACLRAVRPELASCNAGGLTGLRRGVAGPKAGSTDDIDDADGSIQPLLDIMREIGCRPVFDCIDMDTLRLVALAHQAGRYTGLTIYNAVLGLAAGMPCSAEQLRLLTPLFVPGCAWHATLIGRQEVWRLHQVAADMGAMLRIGLGDTVHLPDGSLTSGNGPLIEALAQCADRSGRGVASPDIARLRLGLADA
ncbi:MAG: 3-keto-5-aminohexanoate cleavage protein [Aquabacterium sp.]